MATFSLLSQCFYSFPLSLCIPPGLEHKDPEEGMQARVISHEWSSFMRAHSWVLLRTYPTLIVEVFICSTLDNDAPFQLVVYSFCNLRTLGGDSSLFLLRSLHPFRSSCIKPKMTPYRVFLTWAQVWFSFLYLFKSTCYPNCSSLFFVPPHKQPTDHNICPID